MDELLRVLHPDVVIRNDFGGGRPVVPVRGALNVARGAKNFSARAQSGYLATINGAPGAIAVTEDGNLFSLAAFTVVDGKIVAIDVLSDPERMARIDRSVLEALPRLQTS
jgi:RNA polymerase sigma-70 factor (ECF subfamily)